MNPLRGSEPVIGLFIPDIDGRVLGFGPIPSSGVIQVFN